VADLGFSQGEWTFFLISGAREAVVEIELSEPHPKGNDDGAGEGVYDDD
jgi:hypothetical protein